MSKAILTKYQLCEKLHYGCNEPVNKHFRANSQNYSFSGQLKPVGLRAKVRNHKQRKLKWLLHCLLIKYVGYSITITWIKFFRILKPSLQHRISIMNRLTLFTYPYSGTQNNDSINYDFFHTKIPSMIVSTSSRNKKVICQR